MKTANRSLALVVTLYLGAVAVAQDSGLMQRAHNSLGVLPDAITSPDNPITPAKTALGEMLFYETRISVDKNMSCFRCHWVNLYATDGLRRSEGADCAPGKRNAPTVFNAAGEISEHWDGRRSSVEDQARNALLGADTYKLASYEAAAESLRAIPGYEELFARAFPGQKNPVTADNFALAVGAWERTLTTPSRFDAYLAGHEDSLTTAEKAGLQTFLDTGCASCHNSAFVGGQMYRKFGVTESYWKLTGSDPVDEGRYDVTGKEADRYVFKVPSLRNVEMTAPYFSDGSVPELHRAVKIMAQLQLGKQLTDDEAASIVTFLKTLTGDIPATAREVPVPPPAR